MQGLDAVDYQELLYSTPEFLFRQGAVRLMGQSCRGKGARVIDHESQ